MTTITIPGTFPNMNQIIAASKRHWSSYAKFKRTSTDLVVATVKNQYPPVTDYPVCISFDWYCKDRRTDHDNIAVAKKFLIDGLVTGGILVGDGWNHVNELSDRFHVDSQNPRVVVNIRGDSEMGAAAP